MATSAAAIELRPSGNQQPNLDVPGPQKKKKGWAIVGLGDLALGQILPAFAVANISAPVAVVSGHPEKAKNVAEHYGIKPESIYSYENFDAIAKANEIDIVYIVLPNTMHAEYTIRALNAGKHVLCEKPFATSVAEGEKMIETAKSKGKKLMCAYRLRYEPFNQKMIKFARSKEFGPIRTISAENLQDVSAPNIRLSKELGGGPLGDVGIYCLNAARYITGEEPIEVSAMSTQPKDDARFAEVPDRIVFQLRFPSGVLANCTAGFSSLVSRRYQVSCQDGYFGLDPAFAYSNLKGFAGRKSGREMLDIEAANQFAAEMDHFSACVMNDAEPTTPGEEGLRDVRIMEKIREAADSGRTVKV